MDEYPRVLLVSIKVMPGITDDWFFHLVTARSDLTEFDFAFSSKTPVTWQPGDMIPLHDALLIPDSDRIGGAIAEEMLLYGRFVKDDEYDITASGYVLAKEVDVMRGAYLRAIFRLMLRAGIMLHVSGRDWRYIPDFDKDAAAQFQLGYLIAEYSWKYKHERAALSGYKTGQGLEIGRKEAAKEKKRQGDLSQRAVFRCAREIVKLRPALAANTLGLAREIHKSVKAPLKPDGRKLGVEAIREHLQKLKASGKLTISG